MTDNTSQLSYPLTYSDHHHGTHEGSCESLLKPLTNLLKSENTSRLSSGLPVALEPVGGPLNGGEPSAANRLSAAPKGVVWPPSTSGKDTRLPAGLVILELIWAVDPGSMSSEDRNDVLSSSVFVLVIVKNESRRLFWSFRGVPLRSKIYRTWDL